MVFEFVGQLGKGRHTDQVCRSWISSGRTARFCPKSVVINVFRRSVRWPAWSVWPGNSIPSVLVEMFAPVGCAPGVTAAASGRTSPACRWATSIAARTVCAMSRLRVTVDFVPGRIAPARRRASSCGSTPRTHRACRKNHVRPVRSCCHRGTARACLWPSRTRRGNPKLANIFVESVNGSAKRRIAREGWHRVVVQRAGLHVVDVVDAVAPFAHPVRLCLIVALGQRHRLGEGHLEFVVLTVVPLGWLERVVHRLEADLQVKPFLPTPFR